MEIRSIAGSTQASFPTPLTLAPVRRAVLAGIRFYKKWISPFLPMSCRFDPTCSRYAQECFERWGMLRAASLSLQRLLRCHPFHPGGFDPVPSERSMPAPFAGPTPEGREHP